MMQAFTTQDDLMAHIEFQRAIKLWREGFGYTDKIRWMMELTMVLMEDLELLRRFIKMDLDKKNLLLILLGFSRFLKNKLMRILT